MVERTYDLMVIGAGSGDMLLRRPIDGWRTAIVESDRFGGTCLNRGCIPSKMFAATADAIRTVRESSRLGVHASLDKADWPAARDRIFDRIDPLHQSAVDFRRDRGTDVYAEPARFIGERTVRVGADTLTADQIVLASGSRPVVPDLPGLDTVSYHTSDTIMRVPEAPRTMIVVGGGFIAAEMAHVFEAFGTDVTIVQRGPRLLPAEDEQISQRFTDLAASRFHVLLDSTVVAVAPAGDGVRVTVERVAGQSLDLEAEVLLLATGRRPNTDLLDAAAGGFELDRHGHVVTDDYYRTSVPGVWSLGDATNHFQLKHMANAEVRTVLHNLLHPEDLMALPHRVTPHAVFSDPQVAAVGLTEAEARASGTEPVVAIRPFAKAAYGWALEDTTSFVKLIADARARTLLGAHIIGPHAALLIQPLVQGMMLGHTVDELARDVLYIHPALSEVVEQALLRL